MYVNDNGFITYNEISIFIIDLLNHQVMLINMIAPVIVNVLQLALHGKATPQFPTEPIITSNEENNNIEEKKQQDSTNKVKNRSHSEWKIVN